MRKTVSCMGASKMRSRFCIRFSTTKVSERRASQWPWLSGCLVSVIELGAGRLLLTRLRKLFLQKSLAK